MNEPLHADPAGIDNLIDGVVAELANPPFPAGMEARLHRVDAITRSSTMPNAAVSLNDNLIAFTTLDRVKGGRSSRATIGWALLAHAAALLLIITQVRAMRMAAPMSVSSISFAEPPPLPKMTPKAASMAGGGGQHDPSPVTRGNPPKFSPEQLNPPKVAVENAKLSPPATVNVQSDLKMATSDLPQFGMPNSPLVGMSLGNGRGTGLGSGVGDGVGPGTGGGYGGGLRRVGGGVSAPVVLFAPEPEFSEEARKAKVSGDVTVYLQVDVNGRPTHVRVSRGIGLGLDEKALEAVRQYRFKPAFENGHAVPVEMNVIVNFNIY